MNSTLDTIAHTNNLRNVDSRLKLIFTIPTLLIITNSKNFITPLIVFILTSSLILFAAKIRLKIYLLLLSAPLFFGIITVLLMSMFYGYSGNSLYSFKIFSYIITVQKQGLEMGLLILSRTIAGSSCLLFLALTTPMTEIFPELKRLKIPDIVIELSMMIYRYIFVFLEQAEKIWLSAKLRGGINLKVFSMLIGNLFIRTIDQGEKLFVAMNSRCYDGDIVNLANIEKKDKINLYAVFGILFFEVFLIYLNII